MLARAAVALFLLIPAAVCAAATDRAPSIPPEAAEAGGEIEITPVVLPAPPFPPAASGVPENALRQVSARPNAVTDTEAWFERTGVRLPVSEVPGQAGGPGGLSAGPAGALPPGVPLEFRGLRLVKALSGRESTLLFYGPDWSGARLLVGWDAAAGRSLYAYDFASYEETPGWTAEFATVRLLWAVQQGRTLYVSHAHPTYARETGGKNAYLSAIDLDRGRLLWRSPALVANAATFVVEGGLILSGYGFTAEPDFIYLLDSRTGEVRGRHKVKSGPEILAVHDGKLHVRCYDTDYVFELPAAPPAP